MSTTNTTEQTCVNTFASFDERIAFLRKCAKLYEVGSSPISDAEYDMEYYTLQKLVPNDPFFDEVGGEIEAGQQTVKHEVVMGSLNKSLTVEDFLDWLNSTYAHHSFVPQFVLQHKIDGLSLSCIYKNGKLVQAVTRGDGSYGIDVTKNAIYVGGIPSTIPFKGEVEIRGEAYKDRVDFYKNWHTSVGGEFKNPRNFASGAINQPKDPKKTKERGIDFIAYEIVRKDFDTEREKDKFLRENGFNTLKDSTKVIVPTYDFKKIAKAVKIYMDSINRKKLPYDIDGVVVKLMDCKRAKSLGSSTDGRKPKANRAVKFPPSEAVTELIDVETNVGRTGNLTPVGILKPVDLDGATIKRVTLHNYGMLRDSGKLRLGSQVIIAKKGDIIPQIVQVRTKGDKDFDFPTECPRCNSPVDWDDTKVNLCCSNEDCPAKLSSRIEYFLKNMRVKGIGGKIIQRLTEELEWEGKPIISSLPEIFYMLDNDRRSEHPFRKYAYLKEQFGEKAYQNIIDAIKAIPSVELATFVKAMAIGQVGTMSKKIVEVAPSIDDIDNLTVDDLIKVDGFSDKKATGFVNGWKAYRSEIKTILKYVEIEEPPQQLSNKLAGKKFCITGTLSSPRTEIAKNIELNGGKVSSSVSSNLDYLVAGEEAGSKLDKANKLGVKVISEADLDKMIA